MILFMCTKREMMGGIKELNNELAVLGFSQQASLRLSEIQTIMVWSLRRVSNEVSNLVPDLYRRVPLMGKSTRTDL